VKAIFAIGLLLGAAAVFARPASAADEVSWTDTLIVSGEHSDLSAGDDGQSGAVGWLRSSAAGSTVIIGAAAHSLADSRWRLLQAGGSHPVARGITLYGEVNVGDGREAGVRFKYFVADLGASRALTERLRLRFEHRSIDIGGTRGHLPKLGFSVALRPELVADVAIAESYSGNLDTRVFSGRLDYRVRRTGFFAGIARGRSKSAVFDFPEGDPTVERELEQVFVGLAVPLPSAELQLVFDRLRLEDVDRRTWTLSVKLPLRRTR